MAARRGALARLVRRHDYTQAGSCPHPRSEEDGRKPLRTREEGSVGLFRL